LFHLPNSSLGTIAVQKDRSQWEFDAFKTIGSLNQQENWSCSKRAQSTVVGYVPEWPVMGSLRAAQPAKCWQGVEFQ
jgi:hypothetical protein